MKQKEMIFWNYLAFSMIQWILVIWFLVSLPFLNPAWTSGSSGFTYCWSLAWRILSITLLAWNESNCEVVGTFLDIALLWYWVKTHFYQSCGHCWVLQVCWHIECSTVITSFFRIWKSLSGSPSPPLVLFIVILPKAHLNSHTKMSGSRWVITSLWLSGPWRSFL